MKKTLKEFSEAEWSDAFGECNSPEEQAALLAEWGGEPVDPMEEAGWHRRLGELGENVRQGAEEAPPLPAFLKQAMQNEVQGALAARQVSDDGFARQAQVAPAAPGRKTKGEKKSGFGPGSWLFLAGACAALAVGAYILLTGEQNGTGQQMAGTPRILTPGSVTGFSSPVFTWEAQNGQAVDLEVIEGASGAVVAGINGAFSPVTFNKLTAEGGETVELRSGIGYRLRVKSNDGTVLAEKRFQVAGNAVAGGPVRETALEGVIRQCEGYLAQNRPADAWMLWSQLTTAEKNDARMQELKKRILAEIG